MVYFFHKAYFLYKLYCVLTLHIYIFLANASATAFAIISISLSLFPIVVFVLIINVLHFITIRLKWFNVSVLDKIDILIT